MFVDAGRRLLKIVQIEVKHKDWRQQQQLNEDTQHLVKSSQCSSSFCLCFCFDFEVSAFNVLPYIIYSHKNT